MHIHHMYNVDVIIKKNTLFTYGMYNLQNNLKKGIEIKHKKLY